MKSIVIDYRWSNKTGIGRHVDYALPMILKSFSKIYLITNNKSLNGEFDKNDLKKIEILIIKSKLYSIKEQFEILSVLPKNYDVCWFPNYNAPIFIRKNKIIHIHDLAHIDSKKNIFKIIFSYLLIFLNIISSKHILTVSNASKKKIMNLYKYLKLDKKIKVIYPGVFDNDIRSVENINSDHKNIILSIGTVKKRKNFLTLVKAFKYLNNDKHFNLKHNLLLKIIGQKSDLSDIDFDALSYESENIKFLGSVSDEELNNIFAQTKLFIFPSLYEGFGMPPIEAMKRGIPTICSNIDVLKEVCDNASIYFESTDAKDLSIKIKKVIANKQLQESLIQKGISHSKKYTWKNYSKLLLDILNEKNQ